MESVPAQPSGAGCICARHTVASVAARNGAVRAIVIIAGVVLSAGVANAIECQSSPAPSNKNQWAWRLIDNKKCWYAGEPGMDKSKLHWAADADRAPEPAQRTAPDPPKRAAPVGIGRRFPPVKLIGLPAWQAPTVNHPPYPFRRGMTLLELKATLHHKGKLHHQVRC